MGLLDKLWDDTLAGPQPDTGLGRLRKYSSLSPRPNSSKAELDGGTPRSYVADTAEEVPRVTRSIMIVKPPGHNQINNGSPPASPSTPPVSPFSGGRDTFRFRRRSTSDAYEKSRGDVGARSSPPSYDV